MNAAAANAPALEANHLPPPARCRRWLVWLLMVVVVVSGLAIGGAGALLVARNVVIGLIQHPERTMPELAQLLGRRLRLTPDQVRRVEEILVAREKRIEALRREVQPRIGGELDKIEEEVSGVLDPQQRERWQKLFEQSRL